MTQFINLWGSAPIGLRQWLTRQRIQQDARSLCSYAPPSSVLCSKLRVFPSFNDFYSRTLFLM